MRDKTDRKLRKEAFRAEVLNKMAANRCKIRECLKNGDSKQADKYSMENKKLWELIS